MNLLDEIGHGQQKVRESSQNKTEAMLGGEQVEVEASQTEESLGDDHWLRANKNGVPRQFDVLEARRLGRSPPMQIVKAAIFDSITGGEIRMTPRGQETLSDPEQDLADFMKELVVSDHHGGHGWDNVTVMAINDMIDIGQSFDEMLGVDRSVDGIEIPVVSLKAVDSVTVQKNVDETGDWKQPPYYQMPHRAGNGVISSMQGEPNELGHEDLLVMQWPGAARSTSVYPRPPVMQANTMVDVIENSMTHLNREYADNMMGAGFLYGQGTNKDADTIEKQFKEVAGDPNAFPVFTGDGDLNWKSMNNNALSLDAVTEQEWFLRLCAALLGVAPQEVGLIKDVNRSTAQQQGSQMFKRLVEPLSETIGQAITNQWFTQFDLYNELGRPFRLEVVYSDPEQERRQEQDSRERYTSGVTTLNEHRSSIGLPEIDTVVEMPDGREIAIGDLPRPHAERILSAGEISEGDAVESSGDE